MIWARSDGTLIGEKKALINGDVVIIKTKDEYEVIGDYPNQNKNSIDQIYEKVRGNNEGLYGSLHSSISAYEAITGGGSLHSGSNVGKTGLHGQNGGIHQSQSGGNRVGPSRGSKQNRGPIKPVRYDLANMTDDGWVEVTYSDGTIGRQNVNDKKNFGKPKYSHNASETVTLSKGQIAALRANYEGDKVFTKKEVAAAIKTIDALQSLPAKAVKSSQSNSNNPSARAREFIPPRLFIHTHFYTKYKFYIKQGMGKAVF